MEDERNILSIKHPFSYKIIGTKKAYVYYLNKHVYTAIGKNFIKLEKAIQSNDESQIQLCLAKMTGNFKHGNER